MQPTSMLFFNNQIVSKGRRENRFLQGLFCERLPSLARCVRRLWCTQTVLKIIYIKSTTYLYPQKESNMADFHGTLPSYGRILRFFKVQHRQFDKTTSIHVVPVAKWHGDLEVADVSQKFMQGYEEVKALLLRFTSFSFRRLETEKMKNMKPFHRFVWRLICPVAWCHPTDGHRSGPPLGCQVPQAQSTSKDNKRQTQRSDHSHQPESVSHCG